MALSQRYNLKIDPDAKISDISVGMQQRVEILKMLYRDNEILIFDEPTAVLTPQEIDELMEIMRGFKAEARASCSSPTNWRKSRPWPTDAPFCAKANIWAPWMWPPPQWRRCR